MNKQLQALIGCMLLSVPVLSFADDYGMVMDLEGEMRILRDQQELAGDLGESVSVGDRLVLAKNSRATIISYLDCREIIMSGPLEVEVTWDKLKTRHTGRLSAGRKMPVCYSHEELNSTDSGVIGGLVLRGAATDPAAALRAEFDKGQASNSTLMTLVMHDLANGDTERARPYFNELRKFSPNSAFVAKVAAHFATAE